MNLFAISGRQPVRSTPDVWISRVVIYGHLTPKEQQVIRDIPLSRGLNIVWAKAADPNADPARIGGHSAGKTTFCRFLRYLLGETTFGTEEAVDAIRRTFPSGYVAAEIHVRGRRWAVRRPLGKNRTSYIMPDADIDELIKAGGTQVWQKEYTERLGLDSLLDDMESSQVVQTGEQITWGHVLAWCSRDQEARFQNLHTWRVQQSGSGTSPFRSSKTGPLFAIRAILGLYQQDELLDEERLASLKRDKSEVEKAIEDATREPQFRVNLYHRHLRDFLQAYFPDEAEHIATLEYADDGTLFAQSLSRLAGEAHKQIEQEIGAATTERDEAQDAIDSLNGRIHQIDDNLEMKDEFYSFEVLGKIEVTPELAGRNRQRDSYEEYKNKSCPWSGVKIRECPEVIKRQRILSISSIYDIREMEQAEARKSEEIERIENEKKEIEESRSRLLEELKKERGIRDNAQERVRNEQSRHRDLMRIQQEYERWANWNEKPDDYSALNILRKKKQALEVEIDKTEQNLAQALTRHNASRELLSSIFSHIVKNILPGSRHDGKVLLDKGEIAFRITRGSMMNGEAISTIAVLWADLAALLYNCVSDKSRHPGILIHDSPREADLALNVYHSFIDFAGSLQDSFASEAQCPFQYIVTTTTEPPKKYWMDKYIKLPLDASDVNGLLLQCDVDAVESALFYDA